MAAEYSRGCAVADGALLQLTVATQHLHSTVQRSTEERSTAKHKKTQHKKAQVGAVVRGWSELV